MLLNPLVEIVEELLDVIDKCVVELTRVHGGRDDVGGVICRVVPVSAHLDQRVLRVLDIAPSNRAGAFIQTGSI